MAEANKGRDGTGSSREKAATNLSSFQTDLLQGFTPTSAEAEDEEEEEEEEEEREEEKAEIELNLGLSLGGRFGVDKSIGSSSGSKKLTRSSSIVGTMPIFREEKAVEAKACPSTAAPYGGLARTTSLPTETEEEWRKRKEMQTLRRMEAKRRRSEKQRNSNIKTEANNLEGTNSRRGGGGANTASMAPPRWSAAANKGGFLRNHSGNSREGPVEAQGDVGRSGGGIGGGSSSMSGLESKPLQACSSLSEETRRPNTTQSTQGERGSQEAAKPGARKRPETTSKPRNVLRRLSSVEMSLEGQEKNEMPYVFTKGEGPSGRRVEGILYRYGKGEEVRIMCVCHGSFLSPAEFVKHAGGGDVDHPLRHIVVNTASSSSSSSSFFLSKKLEE